MTMTIIILLDAPTTTKRTNMTIHHSIPKGLLAVKKLVSGLGVGVSAAGGEVVGVVVVVVVDVDGTTSAAAGPDRGPAMFPEFGANVIYSLSFFF